MMDGTKLPIVFAFFQDGVEIAFVLGGSLGAGIARASFADTVNMLKSFGTIFFYSPPKPLGLVNEIVELANINRRDGPIAMQNVEIKHPFLQNAINMVVDGIDADVIDTTLTTEIALARKRDKASVDYLKFMAEVAPSMGMVGTMIGLVAMLKTMDDLGSIGDAFAIALLTTMWGAIFAYVLLQAFCRKARFFLKKRFASVYADQRRCADGQRQY